MTEFLDWLRHDTLGLLLLAASGIAVLLTLIIRLKIEPFIALIGTGVIVALVGGVSVDELVGSPIDGSEPLIEEGFAGILGHITVIIGLGTVLGAILEHSGGAQVILDRLVRLFGERGTPVAMGVTGFVLGIPVFFDIGIFVLAPLVYIAAARGGRSLALYALPLLAGLSVTHAFLPPHPGPVAAAGFFEVSLGWVIVMGLACGIPAWWASGLLWGRWIGDRVSVAVPIEHQEAAEDHMGGRPPSLATVLATIGLPMLLILSATFGTVFLPESKLQTVLVLFGHPAIALTVAVLLAMYLLGLRRGVSIDRLSEIISQSLRPVGMILLVVGAGAFFGAVLSATGIGDAVADTLATLGMPLIVSAYIIASGMRIAQGSATVAIVTTSGILAPAVEGMDISQPQLALIVMSIASGSIIASHVNDGGFWIVAKYFNMTVKQTLLTWTVLETVLSVVGFAVAGGLYAVLSVA